jgi:hypothetical protein
MLVWLMAELDRIMRPTWRTWHTMMGPARNMQALWSLFLEVSITTIDKRLIGKDS